MDTGRRKFLKIAGLTVCAGLMGKPQGAEAREDAEGDVRTDPMGMLVDTTLCEGCRHCEWACKKANGFFVPPLSELMDTTGDQQLRRPEVDSYTVVNRFNNSKDANKPVYVKTQCMHCVRPGCASACIVGALKKDKDGPVVYDAWKCMGCRYCMVACPFQVPAYEYSNATSPVVRKCNFCFERTQKGEIPACAKICPKGVMTFGKRSDLLEIAKDKIANHPDKYIPHIYGEHEVGGTSWLYLASVPFKELGFQELGDNPVPALNESIQHSVFKHFIPPLGLLGLLGSMMWISKERGQKD